jgi:hypothetical protein
MMIGTFIGTILDFTVGTKIKAAPRFFFFSSIALVTFPKFAFVRGLAVFSGEVAVRSVRQAAEIGCGRQY